MGLGLGIIFASIILGGLCWLSTGFIPGVNRIHEQAMRALKKAFVGLAEASCRGSLRVKGCSLARAEGDRYWSFSVKLKKLLGSRS